MSSFSFFKKQSQPSLSAEKEQSMQPEALSASDRNAQGLRAGTEHGGIKQIYDFLQADYESRGYQDALTNPDDSYKTDNIRLIRLDLKILIQQVITYYEDLLNEIDYHITTRSQAGLLDLVQELEARKKMVSEHIVKVSHIQTEIENENGMGHRIILSYQRGFMRGLSALTQSTVLTKKI